MTAPDGARSSEPLPSVPPGDEPPPAPWTCRLQALVRFGLGRWHLSALAVIAYADTPVGPYGEALSAEVRLPMRITVPWIVVDSAASVAGGRQNWALPKELATLAVDLHALVATVRSEGTRSEGTPPEHLHVTGRAYGPRLPVAAVAQLRQPGRAPAPLLFRGRARAALVGVEGGRVPADRRPGLLLDGVLQLGAPGRGRLPRALSRADR